ncbi:glycosyltransferase [Microbacterium koreense]|uniref:Glycosyltransferase n=1 Tax=Microbacterium koreense TaxID=323761 RepID=A0ABW2ZP10_9MICO
MGERSARRLRVLQSFKEPGPRTNPYITQLRDALVEAGVDPVPFSWRIAILGRYDVFHAHWPEALIERRRLLSTWVRWALYGAFLARLALFRIPVVSTVHNLELPAGISPIERALLKATQRLTRIRIVLNEFTPVPAGAESVLIEHGHYRDWFAPFERSDLRPGRMLFFGKVRRYKNVESLIRAFRDLTHTDERSLHVLGSPSSDDLSHSLVTLAADDPRVSLSLTFASDDALVKAISAAELVVLPYSEMHNSGSVLAALSLDRPVLVPDNAFNRALADEVGHEWVLRYSGTISADDLTAALVAARARDSSSRPDLGRRGWTDAGRRHRDAYAKACEAGSGRRRG